MIALEETPELAEHLAGSTLKEIGARHDFSYEQARRIIQTQGREIVTCVAGELMVARREGQILPVATIPDTSGPGFHLGLRWVDWLVGELAELTFRCAVVIEPCPGGYSVGLEEMREDR